MTSRDDGRIQSPLVVERTGESFLCPITIPTLRHESSLEPETCQMGFNSNSLSRCLKRVRTAVEMYDRPCSTGFRGLEQLHRSE